MEPSELVMEESDLDSCQVALQENGACGQNGTYMYKCRPPNSIYCDITIHTHNTSTYHDNTIRIGTLSWLPCGVGRAPEDDGPGNEATL